MSTCHISCFPLLYFIDFCCLVLINIDHRFLMCRWWAEREISLAVVLTAIKKYHKMFPNEPHWKPSSLLESAVASGAPLREELHFFRDAQKKNGVNRH